MLAQIPQALNGNKGKIVKILGPVVDVEFPGPLPGIYNALTCDCRVNGESLSVTLEVQQHLGDRWVRAVSMSGTEGLNFGTAIFTYSMGETKFKSLPPNVQKALVEAGEQVTREGCKRFEDGERGATEKIKSQGMKVISFSDDDKKQFDTAFKAVA